MSIPTTSAFLRMEIITEVVVRMVRTVFLDFVGPLTVLRVSSGDAGSRIKITLSIQGFQCAWKKMTKTPFSNFKRLAVVPKQGRSSRGKVVPQIRTGGLRPLTRRSEHTCGSHITADARRIGIASTPRKPLRQKGNRRHSGSLRCRNGRFAVGCTTEDTLPWVAELVCLRFTSS
jgi:hypothetical protein